MYYLFSQWRLEWAKLILGHAGGSQFHDAPVEPSLPIGWRGGEEMPITQNSFSIRWRLRLFVLSVRGGNTSDLADRTW